MVAKEPFLHFNCPNVLSKAMWDSQGIVQHYSSGVKWPRSTKSVCQGWGEQHPALTCEQRGPKGSYPNTQGRGHRACVSPCIAVWVMFAVWSLKYFPCQSIHFMKGGEEGLRCWGPHTESSPEPCAHPSSQFLDGLGRKVHLLDAYSICFD